MDNNNKKRLIIMFGGESSEYEVSLRSAAAVINAVDPTEYDVIQLGIDRSGDLYLYSGDVSKIADGSWCDDKGGLTPASFSFSGERGILALRDTGYELIAADVIFPVMHGQYCEDGRLQGLLEMSGIPFVGCKTFSSALCMDKSATKFLLSHYDIPMARQVLVLRDVLKTDNNVTEQIAREIGFPCFVKPANSGSSVGAGKVDSEESLIPMIKEAAVFDSKILVEEYIDAREVEIAVLEYGGKLIVSHSGEIESGSTFYDYDTKYKTDTASYYTPARITPECEEKLRALAGKIFRALSCRGLSRIDFFVTREDERIIFNEINTLPGFTSISMYPKLFERDGLPMTELIDVLVTEALRG